MTFLPYLAIAVFGFFLFIRWIWGTYMKAVWEEAVVLYAIEKKIRENTIIELVETWPLWMIVINFWIWDFRKFIVNQEQMQDMFDYYTKISKLKINEE